MRLPHRIKLDIDQEYYNLIPAQQGDTARVLNFQILNNNIPFSLENKTVRARIKKPDGNVCYNDMEIINASEGECDLKLTNQILIKPGMCKVQLEIMENGEILSTIIFAIFIRESIDIKDAAESTNEFTALENGIIKLDEWDKYFKETSGAIEEKYTERLSGLATSLEEKTKYIKAEKINISGYNNAQTRPLVTFISDDGNRADLQMLQLFNSKGIKGCTAMISGFIGQGNYMTGEELKQLHNAGWDIMLHDTHHRHMATLTEEQLNTAMKTGKETIEALGIPCKGLATPYGSTNSLVKRVAEKYFDYTFGENIGKINTLPIISYDLERINHGGEGMTLAHYQNGVKKAIANNGWCVFCTHYYQLTETQRAEMAELIDWIKEQGVDIVTVTEAMEIFGNVQEYRNYDTDEYFCVTKSGKTLTSENGATVIKPIGNVNNNTPITDFEFNKITVMNFTNGIELGFPVNAGVLETYRDKYEDFNTYCYQKITPVFSADNNIRYRQWDKANKKWQKWFSVNINLIDRVIIDNINGKTATSPIADFENGKITYTTISGSNTVGFPNERAGVLETNKIHSGDNGFQFQKYYESSLTRVWYRGSTASGGWSNWRKFGAFTTLSRPSSQISIPANSTVDSLVLSVPGLISDSIFNVFPDVALPSGIMYCAVPHSTSGNVIIRLVNITTSTVVVPSMNWLCNYTV